MSGGKYGQRARNEKTLVDLLERDPDVGLMTKPQLAARLAISVRQVDYLFVYLKSKRRIVRDQHGRMVLLAAPPQLKLTPISYESRIEAVADSIRRSRKPKTAWLRDALQSHAEHALREAPPDDRVLAEQIIHSSTLAQQRKAADPSFKGRRIRQREAKARRLAIATAAPQPQQGRQRRDRKYPARTDGRAATRAATEGQRQGGRGGRRARGAHPAQG